MTRISTSENVRRQASLKIRILARTYCRQILQKFNILDFLFHQNHKTIMTSMNMPIALQQSDRNTGHCFYDAG